MLTLYVAHGLFIGLLGNGVFVAPLLANITRWFDRHLGMAVAVVATGQSMAGAVWPPVLRYLTDAYGWRQAFFIYAVIALIMLLPLGLVLRAPPRTATAAAGRGGHGGGRVLGWPASAVVAMLCLAIVGCCVAMAMPMVHLIAYATDLGHPSARAAEMLAALLAGAVVSRLLFGALADRIGGLWTLLIGSAGQLLMLTQLHLRRVPGRAVCGRGAVRPGLRRHRAVLRDHRARAVPAPAGGLAHRHRVPVRHRRHGARRLARRSDLRPDRKLPSGVPGRRRVQPRQSGPGRRAAAPPRLAPAALTRLHDQGASERQSRRVRSRAHHHAEESRCPTSRSLSFNHTAFTVSDLDEVIPFFRDLLGFELTSRAPRDGRLIGG